MDKKICHYYYMQKLTLRQWLVASKVSTEVLAQKSGVSRQTISYILNERSDASLETALNIWKATGYEVRFASLFPGIRKFMPMIRRIK